MEAGLLTSLQRTSSIQGLLGQQLSSSQLSFSSSVAPPPLPGAERFCPATLLETSGHRLGQRSGTHYEGHFGKWTFSGRKGFGGPAAVETEGGLVPTIRTQVRSVLYSHCQNDEARHKTPVQVQLQFLFLSFSNFSETASPFCNQGVFKCELIK